MPSVGEIRKVSGCNYEMDVHSAYGCPLECPKSSDSNIVCSGKGVCFYSGFEDGETLEGEEGEISCACEQGYSGDACETALSDTSSITNIIDSSTSMSLFSIFVFMTAFSITIYACVRKEKTIALLSGLINFLRSEEYKGVAREQSGESKNSADRFKEMEFSQAPTLQPPSAYKPYATGVKNNHTYTPLSETQGGQPESSFGYEEDPSLYSSMISPFNDSIEGNRPPQRTQYGSSHSSNYKQNTTDHSEYHI